MQQRKELKEQQAKGIGKSCNRGSLPPSPLGGLSPGGLLSVPNNALTRVPAERKFIIFPLILTVICGVFVWARVRRLISVGGRERSEGLMLRVWVSRSFFPLQLSFVKGKSKNWCALLTGHVKNPFTAYNKTPTPVHIHRYTSKRCM